MLGYKKYTNTNNNVYRHLDYDLFRNLNVIEGSQRVTKELMKKYEVYVVTTATNHPDSLKQSLNGLQNIFHLFLIAMLCFVAIKHN